MRMRIIIDSASTSELSDMTLAYQRTAGLGGDDNNLTYVQGEKPEPTVTKCGQAWGWKSPMITHERARAVMREFSRLQAGLFDHGDHDCTDRRNCEPSRDQLVRAGLVEGKI